METVGTYLTEIWGFTYIFYPTIIISVFISIIVMIIGIISESKSVARSLIGAILPVAVLAFIIASDADDKDSLANLLEGIGYWRLAIGAFVSVTLFEVGRSLMRKDSEIEVVGVKGNRVVVRDLSRCNSIYPPKLEV